MLSITSYSKREKERTHSTRRRFSMYGLWWLNANMGCLDLLKPRSSPDQLLCRQPAVFRSWKKNWIEERAAAYSTWTRCTHTSTHSSFFSLLPLSIYRRLLRCVSVSLTHPCVRYLYMYESILRIYIYLTPEHRTRLRQEVYLRHPYLGFDDVSFRNEGDVSWVFASASRHYSAISDVSVW